MPRSYVRAPGQRAPLPAEGRRYRFYEPGFVDNYWYIQGSVPEKMVMAEFIRRGIYFEHTPQKNPIKWGYLKEAAPSDPTNWEADFLLPQFKIWLEVQGTYFHTLPGVPEKEALRFAIIEAAGWKPIYWWDYDIENKLQELMDSVPEFYNPPSGKGGFAWRNRGQKPPKGMASGKKHAAWHSRTDRYKQDSSWGSHHNRPRTYGRTNNGLPFYEGGDGVDHLKGLRTANRNRATTPQYESKRRVAGRRRTKYQRRYHSGWHR